MDNLNSNKKDLLAGRKSAFDKFMSERMPVLANFAHSLGLENPALIVNSPSEYLAEIDFFMKNQIIEPEDKVWIHVRLGYFIGELFVEKFGGCWFVNDIPNSKFFTNYCVGRFTAFKNQNLMIDPFHSIELFLSSPVGRSLEKVVLEIENELILFDN